MERDPRIANASKAIVSLGDEMVAGGVSPLAVANETALGLGQFLAKHFTPTQAAGMLREQAVVIDPPNRDDMAATDRELLDLADHAQSYINAQQIAGIEERDAVSALVNACTLRVARQAGAAGAAAWLRGLANNTEAHAAAIDMLAHRES